jgi:glycosyltransferase involved in cell wall biosynthesis
MHILHITPYFYPAWAYGGTCRAAWEVARRMAARGHKVTAYTTDALDGGRRAVAAEAVVEQVAIRRFRNLSNWLAWRRLFMPLAFGLGLEQAIRRADVVHLHEYRSFQDAVARPILHRLRKPYILTAQGGVPLLVGRFAIKRVYDAWVGRGLLRRACRLHALNTMEARQFVEAGGRPEQVFVAPNGIDVEEFRELPSTSTFRARHHIPEDAPLVLFLARVSRIKGVDFLVSAFADLSRTLPGAVLVIAGPDDGDLARVQAQVAGLGLENRVRFAGYVAGRDRLEAYQAADVYVLPSSYEILGITLLEALACGAPVVATDRCGLAEAIESERLGHVVGYGQVARLAQAIAGAVASRTRLRQDAARRREYVLVNYDWNQIAEKWEAVYQACASEKA